jgi:hypothetical protein
VEEERTKVLVKSSREGPRDDLSDNIIYDVMVDRGGRSIIVQL